MCILDSEALKVGFRIVFDNLKIVFPKAAILEILKCHLELFENEMSAVDYFALVPPSISFFYYTTYSGLGNFAKIAHLFLKAYTLYEYVR